MIFISTFYEIKQYFTNDFDSLHLEEADLMLLSNFIKLYTTSDHLLKTDFEPFMINRFKKITSSSNSQLIICVSYLKIAYTEENEDFFRRSLGYSKVYSLLKKSIQNIKEENSSYKYLAYLMLLLDHDTLVYKNLKSMLKDLIKHIKNDIVDSNIAGCARITSAVVSSAPTLFTERLALSLISYFTKIIYTERNYVFMKYDQIKEILISSKLLFKTYKKMQYSNYKKFSIGIMREIVGKMEEYRTSSVYEEVLIFVNLSEILPYAFNFFIEPENIDLSFLEQTEKYLEPTFISKREKKSRKNRRDQTQRWGIKSKTLPK